jgi:hypothetical protein
MPKCRIQTCRLAVFLKVCNMATISMLAAPVLDQLLPSANDRYLQGKFRY